MLWDRFLAIDYGTTHIKGVLIQNSLGKLSIVRKEILEIVQLEDEEMDDYEYNIIRFIQSFFPEEYKYLINLNLDRIYIRDLVIPLTNEKAVREIIPFEVENKLPFPSESMEVLGILSKTDENNTNVVTFNVEKVELERIISPFTRGEATLACLSVDSFVLTALLNPKDFSDFNINELSVGQLDIGGEVSIFNIIDHGKLIHTRSIQIGGNLITSFIQSCLNTTYELAEECKLELSPYFFQKWEELPLPLERIFKKYKINLSIWKQINNYLENDFLIWLVDELNQSIQSVHDSERPQRIFLSGGSAKISQIEEKLSLALEIPVQIYPNIPEELEGDIAFLQAYSTGLHYIGKTPQKLDFLKTESARKIKKNEFQYKKFLPHLIIAGVSVFILLFVFIFGIIIDKRKIEQNRNVLVEKYKRGFGEEPPDPKTVISSAMNKLKQEQKKTEIFRLFLNKESVLDALAEASDHFPDKENLPFQLTKFIYQDDEIQIYGKVNEYAEIGLIEQALARSLKFKDIKVLDKRMTPGINKFKVTFKLRMTVAKPEEE